MRIAFLVYDLYGGGGGEKVACQLANYFSEEGKKVSLVSIKSRLPNKSLPLILSSRVAVYDLRKNSNRINLFRKTIEFYSVKKFFSSQHFDYVLGIGTYPSLLLSFLKTDITNTCLACIHGSYNILNIVWKVLLFILLRRCKAIVSLTEHDAVYYRKIMKNVFVIPNIAEVPIEQPPCTNKKILAVGRMDFLKGYDLMLDILRTFFQKCPDWRMVIRGDGPLKEKIKKTILEYDLERFIELRPYAADISSDFSECSFFIHTSRSEGFPMVLLEASAYGLPIVAYNCKTGPNEIILDGESGFLINCYEKDKFVDSMITLATDLNKRCKMGACGRERIKDFSKDIIMAKWSNLFERLDHDS